jgi:exodeoxyribonuclease-3
MRIATWNINSVRLRLPLVERFIAEHKPDILCLQETKTPDEFFPKDALAKLGFTYQHFHGMKGYNGVAILSRVPMAEFSVQHWAEKQDCRHIHARTESGLQVHCLYVPAGGDIPDPKENIKFAHKLQLLDEVTGWWKTEKKKKGSKVLVGDLNIAPLEHDVWSHKQLLDVVSHTPIEVEKMAAMQKSHDWVDAVRHFVPHDQKLYSWWSYRAADWLASDRGRRLDHVWVTPDLVPSLKATKIIKDARGWDPKPSDHVPVIVDIG